MPTPLNTPPLDALPSRRDFLQRAGLGLGGLALHPLLGGRPHFAPKAKNVIMLFMYGGVSHIDTFERKPALEKYAGKQIVSLGVDGLQEARTPSGVILPPRFAMRQHGQSGHWICDQLPHLARIIDKLTFVHGIQAHSTNHGPALLQMNSGTTRVGFPSVGSWVSYGLGSPNADMPGFVVLYDHRGGPINGPQLWGGGFLSARHQGTPMRPSGSPILDLQRPGDLSDAEQRAQLDLLRALNEHHGSGRGEDSNLNARIQSFELAYRMQSEAPRLMDVSGETRATRQLYGIQPGRPTEHFGAQCLLARRLVEGGVRFVQLYSGGGEHHWDAHQSVSKNHTLRYAETDRPIAGLITDLERRGLLDETLVIYATEFGRTPHREYNTSGDDGRDHHPFAFSMFFAGGGMRPGTRYGDTDELGYYPGNQASTVPDIHATILHLLGIDHERLTYPHNGRDARLTDVSGRAIGEILA